MVNSPSSTDQEEALSKLLASSTFQSAPALSRLLKHLVERDMAGDAASLKEVLIGHTLFGRPLNYDPKIDAVVRVSMARLRLRLKDYYLSAEGRSAPLEIVIPKGSYGPNYLPRVALHIRDTAGAKSPYGGEAPRGLSSVLASNPAVAAATVTDVRERHSGVRARVLWITAALLSAMFLLKVLSLFWMDRRVPPTEVWTQRPFLDLGGSEQFPDFSPDGQEVVFAWTNPMEGSPALYVQKISEDTPKRLVQDGGATRPAWSPDGKRLAFLQPAGDDLKRIVVLNVADGTRWIAATLRGRLPWLCGLPRLSWSRDGRELFSAAAGFGQVAASDLGTTDRCGIVAIDTITHNVRPLTQSPSGTLGDLEPAVSPDGSTLAFLREVSYGSLDAYLIDLRTGRLRRLTYDRREVMGFAWSRTSDALLLASRGDDGVMRLIRADLRGGPSTPLTNGGSPAAFPTVSRVGERIAFTSYHSFANVYRLDGTGEHQLISDRSLKSNIMFSPDGTQLLYVSDRTGYAEVWISDADGSHGRRLTHSAGTGALQPSWSPDGHEIAFECRDRGHSEICVVAADGRSASRHVTEDAADQLMPSWARSGNFIYYSSDRSGRREIYRKPIHGGVAIQMTVGGGARAIESWNGRHLYVQTDESGVGFLRIPVGASMIETSGLTDANRQYFIPQLSRGEGDAWDVGKDGIAICRGTGPDFKVIRLDPKTGLEWNLFSVKVPADEINTLSVAPDGHSMVLITGPFRSSEIDMMERGSRQ